MTKGDRGTPKRFNNRHVAPTHKYHALHENRNLLSKNDGKSEVSCLKNALKRH